MEIKKLYYSKRETCEILGIHRNSLYFKTDCKRYKKFTMKQIEELKTKLK